MTINPFNPYEAPKSVEIVRDLDLQETDGVPERRHHLSNRFMSFVIGIPGFLFLCAGLPYLTLALFMSPRSPAAELRSTSFFIGIVGLISGTAMLWVSVFLWRYDSTREKDA